MKTFLFEGCYLNFKIEKRNYELGEPPKNIN